MKAATATGVLALVAYAVGQSPTLPVPPPTVGGSRGCNAYKVISGSGGTAQQNAWSETRHEVTCCATGAVSGWARCPSSTSGTWGERDGSLFQAAGRRLGWRVGSSATNGNRLQLDSNGCVHLATWNEAAQFCNAIIVNAATNARARLCTRAEMRSIGGLGCGVNKGCQHNNDMVWSSERATNVSANCIRPAYATSGQAITSSPTDAPTEAPTDAPTMVPTTAAPTAVPTTYAPTDVPTTATPTDVPTMVPTTQAPTTSPTAIPTTQMPTMMPTTAQPTFFPTTLRPTFAPVSADASSSDDNVIGDTGLYIIIAAVVVVIVIIVIVVVSRSGSSDQEPSAPSGTAFANPIYDDGKNKQESTTDGGYMDVGNKEDAMYEDGF